MLKEVEVVAPKEYFLLGKRLAEKISSLPHCKGSFISLSTYKNENRDGEIKTATIFLGSPKENIYTKKHLPLATERRSHSGAYHAHYPKVALLFGDGKFESATELKAFFEKYETAILLLNRFVYRSLFRKAPLTLLAGAAKNLIFAYLLKLLQTDAAASFFLENAFMDWLGQSEEGENIN